MAIDRTYYCEGPDCEAHARTGAPSPLLPVGFIEARHRVPGADEAHHFCSWDCVMKFAAGQPLREEIDV